MVVVLDELSVKWISTLNLCLSFVEEVVAFFFSLSEFSFSKNAW